MTTPTQVPPIAPPTAPPIDKNVGIIDQNNLMNLMPDNVQSTQTPQETPVDILAGEITTGELAVGAHVMSDGPTHFAAATFLPQSANVEKRTITCVAYSGAKVPRYDWRSGEEYDLTLSTKPDAIRMGRMESGAPVLDAHSSYSTGDVFGVVEKCWMEKGKLMATVRFSTRAEVDPVWDDVRNGILRNWSIGLWIHQTKDMTEKGDKRRSILAIDWEPFELSLVPIPADSRAQSMSAMGVQQTSQPTTIGTQAQAPLQKGQNMATNPMPVPGTEPQPVAQPVSAPPAPPIDSAVIQQAASNAAAEAVRLERERFSAISQLCAKFKLPQTFTDQLTSTGISLADARVRVMDELAARQDAQPTTVSTITMGVDAADKMRATMAASLLHRSDPDHFKAEAEAGRQWMGLSLLELGRHCLTQRGTPWAGKNKDEVAYLALTTSDLSNIVMDVANKSLRRAYMAAPQTFKPLARRTTAPDFKNVNRVQLSHAPALLKVNEHGEIEHGPLYDSNQPYALLTYARIVGITRKTIVNDDLDALTRIPASFGIQAANLESDVVWAIITANPTMNETNAALFSTTHANLAGSGSAIGVDSIGAGRTAMALQTSPDGTRIGTRARFLVVPVGKETLAEQFMTPIFPVTATTGVPQSMRNLTLISEPRLDSDSATAWYLFADPSAIDTIEYAYLEGQEGVYQETRVGFEVDGIELKARMDFGAGAIDYRGVYKNPGA